MKVQHRKVKMLSLASPGVSESEACVQMMDGRYLDLHPNSSCDELMLFLLSSGV